MNNKTKGIIAGVAGIALLTGGSTFALWSASTSAAGGTITNGSLEVGAIGTPSWQDVSPDRADSPHTIDLATWRMVPGDVVEGRYAFEVALEGDNLVATLGVDTTAGAVTPGVTVTYDVVDKNGAVLLNDVALGTDSTLRFAAGRTGQGGTPANAAPTVVVDKTALVGATPNLSVVLTATFASSTDDQASVDATTVLGDLVVNLSQVRTGADFA